ncbi:MAG: Ig-like domain-containing protein [Paludibacter sp.]|nr:Ig-like domain-containing protein [Paludibacter sp.]
MMKIFISILVLFFSFSSLSAQNDFTIPFSTDSTQLTVWNGNAYVPFFMKGINLGIAKPGTNPGELEATREQYSLWFNQIKDAGFNCIRIYTLHYPHFYEELYKFNTAHPQHPLFFIQGVWLNEVNVGESKDLVQRTDTFKAEIEENIDCLHGNKTIGLRFGKAFGPYTADVSPWNMAYIIGREISPGEVLVTNELHPDLNQFNGDYLGMNNGSASEIWLTSNLDYTIQYEKQQYNTERPVSASSWPTLDPIIHLSEPNRDEDTASVDLSKIELKDAPAGLFISYHAYPYYPDFIGKDPLYKTYSDNYGPNSYLGYLIDLKSHYKKFPLIIAEYGVPSSWGVAHYASSGMNHGGFDEVAQGEVDMRMLQTLQLANTGGGIQFAWMDEWFKRTWITDNVDYLNRLLWDNVTAAEQNFGLIKFVKNNDFERWKTFSSNDDLTYVNAKAGYDFFEVEIGLKDPMEILGDCWVAFDTYDATLGELKLPTGFTLPTRSEFALHITQSSADLYVTEAYDLFGIYHQITTDKQIFQSTVTDGAPWKLVRWKNNSGDEDVQYIGSLKLNHDFQPESSKDAVTIYNNKMKIRLPWTLLQFVDPSQMKVFHDDKATTEVENRVSDGISLGIQYKDKMYQTDSRFSWDTWTSVKDSDVEQELKTSYWTMYDQLQNFNSPAIAYPDSFDLSENVFPVNIIVSEGVLKNDFDLDGQVLGAVLDSAPKYGYLELNTDGSFTYIPQEGFLGTDSFWYSIFDGQSLSVSNIVKLKIGSSNGGNIDTDIEKPDFVMLTPNPASNYVIVSSDLNITDIKIFNLSGRLLSLIDVNKKSYTIDLSRYNSGLYIVVAEIKGKAFSKKLIVK